MNKFFISAKEWFLLGFLVIALCAFCYFGLYQYLSFNTIKTYQYAVQEWTLTHYKSAVSLYILIYIAMIACAIPCATLLALLGGFLFGEIAILYAMLGTSLGGMVLFLAIRTAIGARIAAKSTGWIKKMESGFQQNAFHYLLILRLIPIFPCWISNIAAGALNVPLKTFMSATVLGIMPATFIYVMAGRGLDKLLEAEQSINLSTVLSPSILLPFLGLTLLSIFPVFYKGVKYKRLF